MRHEMVYVTWKCRCFSYLLKYNAPLCVSMTPSFYSTYYAKHICIQNKLFLIIFVFLHKWTGCCSEQLVCKLLIVTWNVNCFNDVLFSIFYQIIDFHLFLIHLFSFQNFHEEKCFFLERVLFFLKRRENERKEN